MKVKITITVYYNDPESKKDYDDLIEEVKLWIVDGGPIPQTEKIWWESIEDEIESDYKED